MSALLGSVRRSIAEHGHASTLCRGYTFLESYALYQLTRLPIVEPSGHLVDLDAFDRGRDTVFIMGSGGSVNDISDDDWGLIQEGADTLSFNYFFRGEFVPIDFHIVREATSGCGVLWRHAGINTYFDLLNANPCYDETSFFVLRDTRATDSIWGVYVLDRLDDVPICPYQNDRSRALPGEDIDSIAHNVATLFDAINLAYLMGYSDIVLVGVDLYDRQYFWLEEDEVREVDRERDASASDRHNTANPVLQVMPSWRDFLEERDVDLYVENPRSLLHTKEVLPHFDIANQL